MRLLTHNLLQCHVKNCNTFPLHFEDVELATTETEFNPEFLVNFLPRLDWPTLVQTALELGITTLPTQPPQDPSQEEEFLKSLHHVLMEIKVESGVLRCRSCQRGFPISNGIANMLLHDDEV
jgi:multifunctional methyltransferase subunit TRM112